MLSLVLTSHNCDNSGGIVVRLHHLWVAVCLAIAPPIPPSDGTPQPKPFAFPQAGGAQVTPPPLPVGTVPVLAAETLYIVAHDEPFLLFASPADKVTITRESGPLKIRGKFIDGSRVETRTITAKHIAIVEAVGVGRVELIAVPAGVTDENKAVRQLIDVNHGAQPPPKPDDTIPPPKPAPPPIDPKPEPKPDYDGPLWFITVDETAERTPATAAIINDVAYWQRVAPDRYRHYDKDDPVAIDRKYVKHAAMVGFPALLVLGRDGKDYVVVKSVRFRSKADVEAAVDAAMKGVSK